MPVLADIAVPIPLARAFTYEVPAKLGGALTPGARVVCELGRRKVVGVVLESGEREAPENTKLKPITAVLDREPILEKELLSFLRELSNYYLAPIGEVLRLALPAMEREQVREIGGQQDLGLALDGVRQVGGRRVAFARATAALETPGSLRGQAAAVLAELRANGEQNVARLTSRFGNARSAIKKLEALGLVEVEQREEARAGPFDTVAQPDEPPELNAAQAEAEAQIQSALADEGTPQGFLLFGITGSGKTEVYLRAIAACVAGGRGALMMVPEIALTPQLVSRFRARFGDDVAIIHSGLSDSDRHAMWKRLRSGEVRVAIGVRSALFAPVPNLGLVIVDEEHDSSFKQEEGVRYHARDMALLRAHRAGAVTVLGSATPSLESLALARRDKLRLLRLPERATGTAVLPAVTIIDLRKFRVGPTGDRMLSMPLHRAIGETLTAGEQTILFLNRRGFAPSMVCESCGHVETCQACSVSLTYHKVRGRGHLRCHYCGFEGDVPPRCKECNAKDAWQLEGLGTEQLETTIANAFPSARVARLDRDVAAGAKSERILARMRAKEIDILVGTQMVTKGHDLPDVTLVGVVNADAALSLPDFRASERGFSLLVQVAGRAGRHQRPGRVLIQTRNPEHPAIRCAKNHDVDTFVEQELLDREEVGYPPFARLALVRIDAVDETVARQVAERLAAYARTTPEGRRRDVEIVGPAPAPIARLRGRYRFRVMLRAETRGPLRAVLFQLAEERERVPRKARVALDVDPLSML